MPNIEITAADGGTFVGYLSVPKSGKGPGVLLLHAIFGVNDETDHLEISSIFFPEPAESSRFLSRVAATFF